MRIPLIHVTDLYHPPQDPDDHFDLATAAALEEFDLLGVILDVTDKFLWAAPRGRDIPRDPGFVPVAQLSYLMGKPIPAAAGPITTLTSLTDTALDRPQAEQAGVELLLRLIQTSREPVTISVVGSARVVAAAYNRHPELMLGKTKAVVLNAGTSAGPHKEWNVGLDRLGYVALWRSGLPIHWYPCANEKGAFDDTHERGTHWQATHAELLSSLPPRLKAWFCHALTGNSRGDIIRSLDEQGTGAVWENLLTAKRHLWSTASLVMAAGRRLVQTSDGWRFLPPDALHTRKEWSMSLEPIAATARDDGSIEWHPAAEPALHRIFRRQSGPGYGKAMAEALRALLSSMEC